MTKAQSDNIPAEHSIYTFLKKMQVQGVINNYNDLIIPLTRKEIIDALSEIKLNENKISIKEGKLLNRYIQKFNFENTSELLTNFPEEIISDKPKYLYYYQDSIVNFRVNPYFELKSIHDIKNKRTGSFFNYGGRLSANYSDWLAFEIQGTNANVFGSREAALYDKRVEQSYTFNHTGINYFDGTEGYIKVKKSIFELEFGRERILWGTGYINKTLLSDNPQLFDFLKLGVKYKKISYDFIHGWLVQKSFYRMIDTFFSKEKQPKYFAISRLGFNPNNNLSLGISQIIIYGNRPFEAAYLNPFLFWESAQRSMDDLDNSFLALDGRYKPLDGLEVNASITFDDINFGRLAEGEWNGHNNGLIWQTGAFLTYPLMPENINFKVDYQQIRPYMFSHPGPPDALNFTNNGYLLGVNSQPNSAMLSIGLDYLLLDRLQLNFLYNYYIHGENRYDSSGKIIENFGGNILYPVDPYVSRTANFMAGEQEVVNSFKVVVNYEYLSGYYIALNYNYMNQQLKGVNSIYNYLEATLKFKFNY